MCSVQGIFQHHFQCEKVHTILDKVWHIYMYISMLIERWATYSECKQNFMLFKGHASWAKITPARGMLTALACHPTKK